MTGLLNQSMIIIVLKISELENSTIRKSLLMKLPIIRSKLDVKNVILSTTRNEVLSHGPHS